MILVPRLFLVGSRYELNIFAFVKVLGEMTYTTSNLIKSVTGYMLVFCCIYKLGAFIFDFASGLQNSENLNNEFVMLCGQNIYLYGKYPLYNIFHFYKQIRVNYLIYNAFNTFCVISKLLEFSENFEFLAQIYIFKNFYKVQVLVKNFFKIFKKVCFLELLCPQILFTEAPMRFKLKRPMIKSIIRLIKDGEWRMELHLCFFCKSIFFHFLRVLSLSLSEQYFLVYLDFTISNVDYNNLYTKNSSYNFLDYWCCSFPISSLVTQI